MNAAQKEFYLTKDGIEKLKLELEDLIKNKRIEIAARLKEAKEYGDLSENVQYDDAKDQQAFIEGRIAELEHILRYAKEIKSPKKSDNVTLGSTVHLEIEGGKHRYTIVGSTEANPDEGKISNESPIGRALLGRKHGDEVEIEVPSGTMVYKIVGIE